MEYRKAQSWVPYYSPCIYVSFIWSRKSTSLFKVPLPIGNSSVAASLITDTSEPILPGFMSSRAYRQSNPRQYTSDITLPAVTCQRGILELAPVPVKSPDRPKSEVTSAQVGRSSLSSRHRATDVRPSSCTTNDWIKFGQRNIRSSTPAKFN